MAWFEGAFQEETTVFTRRSWGFCRIYPNFSNQRIFPKGGTMGHHSIVHVSFQDDGSLTASGAPEASQTHLERQGEQLSVA